MIKKFKFKGKNPGPKLLVMGAIHGDEICGTIAINNIIEKLQKNENIISGEVVLIPIANSKAYEMKKRYCDENLNRVFKKHDNPKNYEQKLANELTLYVDRCDYLLDLHSMSSNGIPFVFQDYNDLKLEGWAKIIGTKSIVKGWPELYQQLITSDTVGYAHQLGKKGLVVECGQHNDFNAGNIAQQAIINTLQYLGMIEGIKQNNICLPEIITAEKIIYKIKQGCFTKSRSHLDKINKGETIAIYDDGTKIISDHDFVILLPFPEANIGEERWYEGKISFNY